MDTTTCAQAADERRALFWRCWPTGRGAPEVDRLRALARRLPAMGGIAVIAAEATG